MSPASSVDAALEILRSGGLVAFPTETVWGLAASAESNAAVGRLRDWKGRDADKPLSLLAAGAGSLDGRGFEITPRAQALMRRFWPGPLTLILACKAAFARGVARADGAVGVRCSSHPAAAALALAAECDGLGLLTATSLNESGGRPARTRQDARALCDRGPGPGLPQVLAWEDAEDAFGGAPTTVLDVSGALPRVVRWGAVDRSTLESVLGCALPETRDQESNA